MSLEHSGMSQAFMFVGQLRIALGLVSEEINSNENAIQRVLFNKIKLILLKWQQKAQCCPQIKYVHWQHQVNKEYYLHCHLNRVITKSIQRPIFAKVVVK